MLVVSPQPNWLIGFSHCCVRALLGGLLACVIVTAQSRYVPEYEFDHWTTDDGLPQNGVNAILQTQDGYLWLATFDGLVRFDGQQFTVFNKGNTRGIGGNRFDDLIEDRYGTLWALTDDSHLVKYQSGLFTTYTAKESLPPWLIKQIEEDEAGDLQIISSQGIAKWKDGRFIAYPLHELLPTSVGASLIPWKSLSWIYGDKFYLYAHGRLQTYSSQAALPSLRIISVVEDQHRTFWINTKDAGLVRLKNGHFTTYPMDYSSGYVGVAAQEDRKGNIWLASQRGLEQFKDGRFTKAGAEGFLFSENTRFYEDREGNIWIGAGSGLYRAREAAIKVVTQADGLSSNNIYSIYEDRAGGLWFGTWGNGVTRIKDGYITQYRMQKNLVGTFVTTLYEDRDGYMWIGTTRRLYRLNPHLLPDCNRCSHVISLLSAYEDPNGFFNEGVWVIHQDQAGRFWFGTSHGLIKLEDGRYTRYTTTEGLAGNDVKAILEDRGGGLWLGTWSGLSRYVDGRFTSYTESDGLASDHIRTLHEDAEGILWIGTYDGGLSRLKDGHITRHTTRDGLFNNGVFQILEDDTGYFWMSCNKGIYRVKRQELNDFAEGKPRSITSIAYGKTDGLLSVECNGGRQPAGWKTRDGKLWFPTAGGAAVIDPRKISENTTPPPVVIEELRIAGAPVALHEPVNVQPDKKSFDVEYRGLSFIRPEQVKYKYKLAGIDIDWVDAGTRRVAYYNFVPHGEYTFTVIAANSDGVWNQTGRSIRITVVPYWWEIRWVQALMIFVAFFSLVSSIVFWYRRHAVQLAHEHALQQEFSRRLIASIDRERKRIADDLHNEPKQYLFAISKYAWLMLHGPNGLKETFKSTPAETVDLTIECAREIEMLVERADAEMKGIIEDLRPTQLRELRLTAAIENWITRSKELSAVNFSQDIDSIDGIFGDEDEVNIYRMVQEGVNNIVKHSQATDASVSIKHDDHEIVFVLEDNGKGFAFRESKRTVGGGFGLKLIEERAQMMGSKAVIKSAPGRGTQITIKLMLPPQRISAGADAPNAA
jgi:ligand-binding sensor domain-containing protein/signal transduction histidine kinase